MPVSAFWYQLFRLFIVPDIITASLVPTKCQQVVFFQLHYTAGYTVSKHITPLYSREKGLIGTIFNDDDILIFQTRHLLRFIKPTVTAIQVHILFFSLFILYTAFFFKRI